MYHNDRPQTLRYVVNSLLEFNLTVMLFEISCCILYPLSPNDTPMTFSDHCQIFPERTTLILKTITSTLNIRVSATLVLQLVLYVRLSFPVQVIILFFQDVPFTIWNPIILNLSPLE